MRKIITALFITTVFIASCKNDNSNAGDIFTKIYSADSLIPQSFTINANIDNIITGSNGTKIRIYKNSFVDNAGNLITGRVEIRLKEALTKKEMVLGNLTTTYNGKPLETGGMIFIDAIANNKSLLLSQNKSIEVALPADSILQGMSVFSGQQDSAGITWSNPVALANFAGDSSSNQMFLFEKNTNVGFTIDGFEEAKNFPNDVISEISRIAWEGDGLKITKDSVLTIGKYTVRFYKMDRLQKWSNNPYGEKGINSFREDENAHYIFSMKKLGWANIDRLLEDPRTKEVELVTTIENESDFKFVYVTLVTQKMYLPGYQKKDNTFCFSHSDDEPQQLPVGESATIIATAYKNNKPYFAIQKITIQEKQAVKCKLVETTVEKLKADLQEKI